MKTNNDRSDNGLTKEKKMKKTIGTTILATTLVLGLFAAETNVTNKSNKKTYIITYR